MTLERKEELIRLIYDLEEIQLGFKDLRNKKYKGLEIDYNENVKDHNSLVNISDGLYEIDLIKDEVEEWELQEMINLAIEDIDNEISYIQEVLENYI